MRHHAPVTSVTLAGILAGLAGCTTTSDRAAEPVIWAGAMQDENYEIKGKPESGGGEERGYGYDQQGGQMNAQALEQQAVSAPQVHYHIHHHYHYGAPGYAHPTYSVQVHHPMPAYVSPYANNPNGGNPVGPQGYGGYWHPGYGGWGSYNPWMNNGAGGLMPPPGD